jgi:hypothetical protein
MATLTALPLATDDEPGCEYRAAEAGKLKRHKRTYSGERPFACDEPDCEFRAAEVGDLMRHKRRKLALLVTRFN